MNQPIRKPSPHKLAVITWLTIYPLITLTLWLFQSWLAALPLPLRTLLLTVALVPVMTYVGLPLMQRLFAGWLQR